MKRIAPALILAGGLLLPAIGFAEDAVSPGTFVANNVWMMLCAGLVFIMHLGFATLESGLTRAKNTTNILFKNTFIVSAGILTYALVGFNLMYPGDFNGFLGSAGVGLGARGKRKAALPSRFTPSEETSTHEEDRTRADPGRWPVPTGDRPRRERCLARHLRRQQRGLCR